MGFSSMDSLMSAMTVSGKTLRIDWNKNFNPNFAGVVSEWCNLVNNAGNPGAATVYTTGTNLAFQAVSESTAGAGSMLHGGNVSPNTKHIINATACSASNTTTPGVLMLIDMLGFYRVTSITTITAQTLDNTITLPRYTNGAGVQAFIWCSQVNPLGAFTPTWTMTYTNAAGTAGRTTPITATLPTSKSNPGNSLIPYTGTGAGKYGPFFPLAVGDTGVRSIQNFTQSVAFTSGEYAIGLCRPLFSLPLTGQGIMCERDLVNQFPSMPQIVDGACLNWLYYSGAATTPSASFFGHLDVAWG